MMTEANITRLVPKLFQTRGATLKLVQLMSIPGAHSSFIVLLFPSFPARSALTRDGRYPRLSSGGVGEDGQHKVDKVFRRV